MLFLKKLVKLCAFWYHSQTKMTYTKDKQMTHQSLMQALRTHRENVRIIGIDKETGGLNCARNRDDSAIPVGTTGADFYPILQIAAIVYDGYFKPISEEINIIIYHSKEHLEERVGKWSKEQFEKTLMIQCPESNVTLEEAEKLIIKELEKCGITNNKSAFMLGNSIRLDMEFLVAQMPTLAEYFHYRLMDISSFKSLFYAIFGEAAKFPKRGSHDALDDIRESVAELEFYLDNFIVTPEEYFRNRAMKATASGVTIETNTTQLLNPR